MNVITTHSFELLFKKLSPQIQRKTIKKANLFKENHFHPSLKIEKLHPKRYNVWSFRQAQRPIKPVNEPKDAVTEPVEVPAFEEMNKYM